jgi:hypothetical protein
MDGKSSLRCLALIGVAALVVGCGPGSSEREGAARGGAPQSRAGDSGPPSRNQPGQSGQLPGDAAVRPPTTGPNPAAPGAAAAPPSTQPQLMARAEIQPLGDHMARGVVEFQQALSPAGTGPLVIHVMLMGLGSDMSFIGKVLVVHEGQDDLSTQPDGSSGQPVGCGVIEATGGDLLSRGPTEDRGV